MSYVSKGENKYGSGKEKVHTVNDNKMGFRQKTVKNLSIVTSRKL